MPIQYRFKIGDEVRVKQSSEALPDPYFVGFCRDMFSVKGRVTYSTISSLNKVPIYEIDNCPYGYSYCETWLEPAREILFKEKM